MTIFKQVTSIPTHTSDVNAIDMIFNFDKYESFLSPGGEDDFKIVFNITNGFYKDISNFKNILEKMKSPVINVVFYIDKNKNMKLITVEQNSTITFFIR